MNPAYYASPLAGCVTDRIERALKALRDGHPATAEGILETLLFGPYAMEPLTLAVNVCARCGDFMGTDELVGSASNPEAAHMVTDNTCDLCLERAGAERSHEESR